MHIGGPRNDASYQPVGGPQGNKPGGLTGKVANFFKSIANFSPFKKNENQLTESNFTTTRNYEREVGSKTQEAAKGAMPNVWENPKSPKETTVSYTPKQMELRAQIEAAKNSPAQLALRSKIKERSPPLPTTPAPKANTHKLGQFEGTYQPPPPPPKGVDPFKGG